jgi:integrase
MPQGRISKRAVDALRCPTAQDRVFLWDDALSGFGVAAFRSGKKVYYAQYRAHGRTRRIALGDHGRLTPDQARSEAKKLLGLVETGIDPIAQRREARARRTFNEVSADFMAQHVRKKRKTRTGEEYQRLLDLHLLPAIGTRQLANIRRADIARLHFALADRPFAANRCLALLSSIWNWAARREEVTFDANPVRGVEKNPEKGRERFLKPEEFFRLGEALRLAETSGLPWAVDESKPTSKHAPKELNRRTVLDPFAVAAIRLLIFTGARLSEILQARWDQVDIERGILFLADSKTGRKPIYLSTAAIAVLSGLPRIEGTPYIIAGAKKGEARTDLKRPWTVLTRAAKLTGVRLHDLRHSFASYGAGDGLGLPIIGKLLGHSQASTTQRYAHLDSDPLRRASERIAYMITSALDGNEHRRETVILKAQHASKEFLAVQRR